MNVDEAASHGSELYKLLEPIRRLLIFVQVVLKITILHQRQSNSHTGEVETEDNVVVVVEATVDLFFALKVFIIGLRCGFVLYSISSLRVK